MKIRRVWPTQPAFQDAKTLAGTEVPVTDTSVDEGPGSATPTKKGGTGGVGVGYMMPVFNHQPGQALTKLRKSRALYEEADFNAPITPRRRENHCQNGHRFTPGNTDIEVTGKGTKRSCRRCAKDKEAKR